MGPLSSSVIRHVASYDMWRHTLRLYVYCTAQQFANIIYLARAMHVSALPNVPHNMYEGMLNNAFYITKSPLCL